MFHTHQWKHHKTKIVPPWPVSMQMSIKSGISFSDMDRVVNGYEIRILKCSKCGDEKVFELAGAHASGN
jgi:hypothetical protein